MKASQQTMMEHSEVKIRLLETYLKKYLQILSLSPFTSDIYLYDLFSVESYVYLQDKRQTYFAEKTANLAKSICGYNVHFLIAAFWALWYFYPQFVYMRMQ